MFERLRRVGGDLGVLRVETVHAVDLEVVAVDLRGVLAGVVAVQMLSAPLVMGCGFRGAVEGESATLVRGGVEVLEGDGVVGIDDGGLEVGREAAGPELRRGSQRRGRGQPDGRCEAHGWPV